MGEPIPRIKTYIQKLDEVMDGGIPTNNIVIVAGMPGTMKSSLIFSIFYNNALDHGKKGVYFTLEQSRESLIRQMTALGYIYEKVKDKITIVDMGTLRKNLDTKTKGVSWLEVFKMYAQTLKTKENYDLLAVDSLPVFEALSYMKNKREDMFYFMESIRDLNVTAFLITEVSQSTEEVTEEAYLADGVIKLLKERTGAISTQRRIVIDKMRNTNHSTDYYTLLFKDGRFQITQTLS